MATVAATASTSARSEAASYVRFTRPSPTPSAALTARPVNSSSRATASPATSGSSQVTAIPAWMPSEVNGTDSRASGTA